MLELPRIEPKGQARIVQEKARYTSIRQTGPESLRHTKRTYKQALKRQIAAGQYDAKRPVIIPYREDKRYRSWTTTPVPEANAAILYMMDVSGSMTDEQKEIVRTEAFWIDTWLRSQYKHVDFRFVIHDAVAREVDRDTFFHTRESGGTKISSAYLLCADMLEEDYPLHEWNVYPFHFSDGDNWGGGDTDVCVKLLQERLLPRCNQFSYGQVTSTYGSGQFKRDLEARFPDDPLLVTSQIDSKDDIPESIKVFLGKGR
jgi:hypothetical protein